jgi:hypothetical protein
MKFKLINEEQHFVFQSNWYITELRGILKHFSVPY